MKIIKDDDFDNLLIFNGDINKKSIFEENMNINTISSYNIKNKNSSINSSSLKNKNINKIDNGELRDKELKIEIKDLIEPKSYKEAINTLNKDEWLKSMKLELDTLNNNNTWDLVPRPKNTKVLKSR
jgi:hypothetical protein